MRQKKVKQLRREFRALGKLEKSTVTEIKQKMIIKDDKIVTEDYNAEVVVNNFRKFKKERIK